MSQQDTPQIIEGPFDPDLWERWKRERDRTLDRRMADAVWQWFRQGIINLPEEEVRRHCTALRTGVDPEDVPR